MTLAHWSRLPIAADLQIALALVSDKLAPMGQKSDLVKEPTTLEVDRLRMTLLNDLVQTIKFVGEHKQIEIATQRLCPVLVGDSKIMMEATLDNDNTYLETVCDSVVL